MLELILRVIRAILASLYMLFEGMPALESLRSWFGGPEGQGKGAAALLMLLAAALLGLLAFLLVLWLLRRRPLAGNAPPAGAGRVRGGESGPKARGGAA